jgi:hypothetical protein
MNTISTLSSKIKSNPTKSFAELLAMKPPWAQYSAGSWNSSTNVLNDLSGNGRNATTSNVTSGFAAGNGAASSIPSLNSSGPGWILFPIGSSGSGSVVTICSLTRFTDTSKTKCVLESNGGFVCGHWTNNRGAVYGNGWKTPNTNVGNTTDWLNLVLTTSSTVPLPYNILVDGVGRGTSTWSNNSDSIGTSFLTINRNGGFGGSSDTPFAFCHLIIFYQQLNQSELQIVANAFTTYLATGILK